MRVVLLSLLLFLAAVCLGNVYQSCSSCGSDEWYNPSSCIDASVLTKPANEYYSYPVNTTTTLYFNLCGPIQICDGAMACFVTSGGQPDILVYANDDPDYYTFSYWKWYGWYSNRISSLEMSWYRYDGQSSSDFQVQVSCDESNGSFNVSRAYIDDDDVSLYISSDEVCDQHAPTYTYPKNFENLSGNIFLAGQIPMFAMDKSSSVDATFEGSFYYSLAYNSMKLNGTLTNSDGSSQSQVSFLFVGQPDNDPPIMVSYATLPGRSSPQCVLLPNTFDDDDASVDWFSEEKNGYYLGKREYTSIYFEKGTTYNVDTWAHSLYSTPYITLMSNTTNGLPLFVGGDLIAPFLDQYEFPPFISEISPSSLSTANLPQNTFAIPPGWNCKQ